MESVWKPALPETARGLEDRADVQLPLTEQPCLHGETSNMPSAHIYDPNIWAGVELGSPLLQPCPETRSLDSLPWIAMRPETPIDPPELEGGVEDRADVQGPLTDVSYFQRENLNSRLARGQHTNSGVEVEKRPEPGRRTVRSKRAVAQTGGEPPRVKRARDLNYTDGEKIWLLVAKLRSSLEKLLFLWTALDLPPLGVSTIKNDKSWAHHASEGGRRNPKSCQQQWDSLLKLYNLVRDPKLKNIAGIADIHNSFWQLSEDQMDEVNKERPSDKLQVLPRGLKREWYEIIKFIHQIQDGAKKIPSWKEMVQKSSGKVEANLSSSSTAHIASTATNSNIYPGRPLDPTRSQPSTSTEVQESMVPLEPLVSDHDAYVLQGESHDAYIPMEDLYFEETLERENVALEHEKVALEHVKLALRGEKLALIGEKQALIGEKQALIGEKQALKHEKLAFKHKEQAFTHKEQAFERQKAAFELQRVQLNSQGASTSVANTSGVL